LSSRVSIRDRYSFANLDEVLELPDLIAIQRESFKWFVEQGLADAFRDISPIKDFTETLSLELEFDPFDEDLRPPPKFTVEECREKDMTYSAPIFARARFMNAATGEIKEQTVFMGDFPMMTDKGTFIINGTERVVVSQLVRSPGVIFQPGERFRLRNLSKHQLVTGTIHPYRGEWIEFDVEQKPGKDPTAGTRVARKRRLSLFTLLRALGYDEENFPGFLDAFVRHFDFLEGQWEKDRELVVTQEEALIEIYKRARPGEPATPDSARNYFNNAFFEPRRYDLSPGRALQAEPQARPRDPAAAGAVPPARRSARRARGRPAGAEPLRGPRLDHLPAEPRRRHPRLPPGRPGPLRQPAHPQRRRADPEPGPHRSVPHGAGRARAHDHPGRRGDHAHDAHQHPPRGRGHQGVLRDLPAEPVHGPGQPAVAA
jgi:DNA-directed RNA polymerase beta subunit